MPFIAITDLKRSILTDELYQIVRNDENVIQQCIASAEAEMRGYLYDSYLVDDIFSAEGEDRHPLLIQYCADMAIWHIVSATQAGQDLELRKARYDRACKWLKMVKEEDFYSDLPRREDNVQSHVIISSSAEKRNNRY